MNFTFGNKVMIILQTLDDTWVSLRSFKAGDGALPKSNLHVGLDLVAPFAGLPPVGAVEEVGMLFIYLICHL